jgi:DNA-directed RNA polymerase subunit beta'
MGRLIPAGTGMEYYRNVKIAGEDVVEEEPIAEEVSLTGDLGGYEDEARTVYTGLTEEPAPVEDTLAE